MRSMRSFVQARGAVVVIASKRAEDAEICGFVITHLVGRTGERRGYVVTLDVRPEMRRSGIATSMMDEAELLAGAAGARKMALHVFARNEGAIQFYERRGYEREGVQKDFYGSEGGVGFDALVYVKELQVKELQAVRGIHGGV